MARITIDLPIPPSTNAIWRSNRGRVHKSPAYVRWLAEASQQIMIQRIKWTTKALPGHFSATILLNYPDKGRLSDLDNRIKGCFDLLVSMGVITNDRLCRKIYVRWEDNPLPLGYRITVKSISGPAPKGLQKRKKPR